MRKTFLHEVATHYKTHFPDPGDEICIIFPNRRAATFFRQALLTIDPNVQWMPTIWASEDFVRSTTRLRQIDAVSALFELYTIYQNTEGAAAEPFDVFTTWASQLLHDFTEIDLYCVDAKGLFGSVDAAYAMKYWSPDGSELTANQQQYLRFWSRMGDWYERFRSHLTTKGLATSAMAYRQLAEHINEVDIPFKHLIFAGFNALNTSEKTIIKALEKRGKATLLWDADRYYTEVPMNEAGMFMRQYMRDEHKKKLEFTRNHIRETQRNIHITGVAKNIGQTLVAGSILDTIAQKPDQLSDTALVLCDEQLLMPMLEVLPDAVGKANITMGYPMHLLPVSSLFSIAFDLHARSRMVKHQGNREIGFYFKDVQRLLRNAVFTTVIGPKQADALIKRVESLRELFIPASLLLYTEDSKPSALHRYEYLLSSWENQPMNALDALHRFVQDLRSNPHLEENREIGFNLETLFEIGGLINRIRTIMENFQGFSSLKTLHRVYQQLIRQQVLPFLGEPLEGMQIMGLLETRNLDFKNLILLSVNENILPAAKAHRSFIPLDIAAGFGLPTYRERDAVYAYHFYRMIQRAEHVWIVYNTESDEFGKGEKSRFITQIEEELNVPTTTITKEIYVPTLKSGEAPAIQIEKTKDLLDRMRQRFGGETDRASLSPTALSSFLKCSLQFYFKNFSGVRPDRLKEEEMGDDEIGNVAHAVLEKFFEPLINQVVHAEHIDQMLLDLDTALDAALKDLSRGRNFDEGKNILIRHGVKNMLRRQLTAEKEQMLEWKEQNQYLTILSVESWLDRTIELADGTRVKLRGKADRIDRVDQVVRIIDYKSGKVDPASLKLKSIVDVFERDDKEKAVQLLQYVFMAAEQFPDAELSAGIASLRKPSAGLMATSLNETAVWNAKDVELIGDLFHAIASELFNENQAFVQTEDLKTCGFCDFSGICGR